MISIEEDDQHAFIINGTDNNTLYGLVSDDNTSWNASDEWWGVGHEKVALASLLFIFSIATILGNLLVVAAVVLERYLHTATNYFVTSLAIADCLVGLVVMPLSAVYEILEHNWVLGLALCDIWRSLDVLFSTASILNLCVISLDRYWAITDPFTYPTRMSRNRACFLIAVVWVCSGAISFPAILWWRFERKGTVSSNTCPFTDNIWYIIFSSTISFYLPLVVMVFTYYKIYTAAVAQTRSLKSGTKQVMSAGEMALTLRIHRGGDSRHICSALKDANAAANDRDDGDMDSSPHNGLSRQPSRTLQSRHLGKNFSLSRKLSKFAKEKKAAKTLGIVMGVFIICWLPFFIVNLLSGFCKFNKEGELVLSIVNWLGWLNSGMNPVIYACWSRDFRRNHPHDSFLPRLYQRYTSFKKVQT